ncbi:MAG: TonB-dependent copper receptor [Rhodanobacteraceae bacterium]|nr:TonB-dependent copper receptor [Rhodanobacteraceae bacterium]
MSPSAALPAAIHGRTFQKSPLPVFLLSAVLSAACAPLHADEAGEQTLDPIVVTAVLPSTPLTVEIDPKAPRQPVPASDGADLLKSIPGFSLIRKGGSNGDPLLRGMAGSRLGLSFDGGQLAGGCPSRMDPPTAYVAPALYDRVTVIKGPQSVLHGPGNSAGTVLFERDAPRYVAPAFALDGSLLGGSWGRFDQMLDLRAGRPDGYLGLALDHTRSGDYADGDGNRVHSSWDRWSADARVGWTPDERTRVELSAGKGDGQAAYAFSGMDGAKFLRESVALKVTRQPLRGPADSIEAQVYSNYADHVMDNYTLREPDPNSMMPKPMASNVARRTNGGRLVAGFDWNGSLHLDAGLDASTSTHSGRSGGLPGSMMGDWRTKPRLRDARMEQAGAFGELTWHLADDRRIVGGLRADHDHAHGYQLAMPMDHDDAGMGHGMHDPAPAMTVAASRASWLPSGFVRWEQDLAASTTLNVGLGHAQRFPDYWELFGRYADSSVSAFRALAPEKTTQLDLGLQHRGERIDAWVSAYAGIVHDFIVIDRGSGMMAASKAANIDARIAGAEAGVKYRFAGSWSADASLAWAWGADRTRHRPLPQMPPLEGRFGLVRDNGRWSVGALARVVAAQHRVAVGSGNIVGQDLGPSAGFAVLSLNGGYRFSDRVKLAAGIDNLFDRTYAEHVNAASVELAGYVNTLRVNEPGRTAWMELRYAF